MKIKHLAPERKNSTGLDKFSVLRLETDPVHVHAQVFFIVSDQSAAGAPSVWVEMHQEAFFNEYNIEGVSAEQNEIYLEFDPDKVAKNLSIVKTGQSRSVKIRLTKQGNVPNLTFDVELVAGRVVTHDIPVSVLPRKVWSDYQEPALPSFDISVCLPEVKRLRHLLDRYRNLGAAVTVTASREPPAVSGSGLGRLAFRVTSDEGVFTTSYPDLQLPVYSSGGPGPGPGTGDGAAASVRVDIKRLHQFLAGEQLQPKRAIANIVDQQALHMFFLHEELLVQYFLPATNRM